MELRVAMSGRWSYAALNLDPGKQRRRGQEMACRSSVALSDHGDRFGQATSRVCTINMCAPVGPRRVEWSNEQPPRYPLGSPMAMRRRRE